MGRYSVQNINIKECKIMDSKKLPLKISFYNYDENGEDIVGLLKSGNNNDVTQ